MLIDLPRDVIERVVDVLRDAAQDKADRYSSMSNPLHLYDTQEWIDSCTIFEALQEALDK